MYPRVVWSALERDSSLEADETVIERNRRDLEERRMARHVEAKLVRSESVRQDATWWRSSAGRVSKDCIVTEAVWGSRVGGHGRAP